MAISRSIITWDSVFLSKDYTEIYKMLVTNYKAIYGSDINLAVNTADGEFLRTLATMLYDFSKLAADTYNSLDINNAKGALLDNLVLLSGNLVRKGNNNTRVRTTLSWTGDDIQWETGNIILAEDVNGSYWQIDPVDENDLIESEGLNYLPALGISVLLTNRNYGESIIPNETFPIREIRRNAQFVNADSITLNNIVVLELGSIQETDAHLRARKKESLSYNSTSLIDSIREEVLNNIFSVDDIKIYNSVVSGGLPLTIFNGSTNTNITVPQHDVFVLVKPQESVTILQDGETSEAIVDVLKRKITLGISTYQANIDSNYITEVVSLDEQYPGYTETYRYYISQAYNPHIRINYTALTSGFNLAASRARIQKALYDLAKEYPINKNINVTELANIAFNAGNIDRLNPTFRIDSVWIKLASAPATATSEITVNNGYWYVSGEADTKITLVTS